LKEVRVVSDDPSAIVGAVNALRKSYDHVFTSGGIGPTHDDITADCVAQAFGDHIDVRADADKLLGDYYAANGRDYNAARKRMARIPDSASLIENPVSIAPGFTIGNVHVMAGVPSVFQAMVATVLATLGGGSPLLSESVRIDRGEGDIAGPLGELAESFPDISIGSYPFQENGRFGANVVLRSPDPARLAEAKGALEACFEL
ncbi:MAG: molybdopterin-binding protein, partial [Pseudomonadota bacterium]